jgi:flagellar basal-body rod modification protein FlgD
METSGTTDATKLYASIWSGTKPSTKTNLGKDEFLQLLVAQLRNQDPTKPMEDKDFMAQLAQFNSLEQIQDLNTTMLGIMVLQQVNQGSALIGKTVTVMPVDAEEAVTGKVSAMSIVKGEVLLQIGEKRYSLRDLVEVKEGA